MAEETQLDFRILGDLEVWHGATRLDIGSPRRRALLGILVLHRNRVVSTDRLADLLWGASPPATAANTLHVLVSGIRRSLNGEGSDSPLLTRRPGYELRTEHGQVDLERFEDLRAAALATAARGDHEAAADHLRAALELWRGDPLPELGDIVDLAGELGRLRELRLAAVEDRIDADLAVGRHHEVVGELEALVDAEPLHERLRAQLMLALYRSGRQARALEVYRLGRRRLVDELGVEPGPTLRELQLAILRQDASVDASPGERERQRPPVHGATPRRRWRFLTPLAILVAVTAVATIELSSSSTKRTVANGLPLTGLIKVETTGATRVLPLPREPGAVADIGVGFGWLWVTTPTGLEKINPNTGRVAGSVSLNGGGGPLATGLGKVFVTGLVVGSNNVQTISPQGPALQDVIPTQPFLPDNSQTAFFVRVGFHSIWVWCSGIGVACNGRMFWRMDPATGRVRARWLNPNDAGSYFGVDEAVTVGAGSVWLLRNGRLWRINPTTNVVSAGPRLDASMITTAAGAVWAVSRAGVVSEINPALYPAPSAVIWKRPLHTLIDRIAVGGNTLWCLDGSDQRLIEIDATTHRLLGRIRLPVPQNAFPAGGEPFTAVGNAAWVGYPPTSPF